MNDKSERLNRRVNPFWDDHGLRYDQAYPDKDTAPLSTGRVKEIIGTFAAWLITAVLGGLLAIGLLLFLTGCATTVTSTLDPSGGGVSVCVKTPHGDHCYKVVDETVDAEDSDVPE